MPRDERTTEAGFTLVEVLVALVVTALLLGIVMNAALEAKARGRIAEDKRAAVLLASTLVSERSVAVFSPSEATGENGRLRWRVTENTIETDPRGLFVLAGINVTVSDAKGTRLFAVQSRKLKATPRQ